MKELDTSTVTDYVEFDFNECTFGPALNYAGDNECDQYVNGWYCTREADGHEVHVAGALYEAVAAWPDGYVGKEEETYDFERTV